MAIFFCRSPPFPRPIILGIWLLVFGGVTLQGTNPYPISHRFREVRKIIDSKVHWDEIPRRVMIHHNPHITRYPKQPAALFHCSLFVEVFRARFVVRTQEHHRKKIPRVSCCNIPGSQYYLKELMGISHARHSPQDIAGLKE